MMVTFAAARETYTSRSLLQSTQEAQNSSASNATGLMNATTITPAAANSTLLLGNTTSGLNLTGNSTINGTDILSVVPSPSLEITGKNTSSNGTHHKSVIVEDIKHEVQRLKEKSLVEVIVVSIIGGGIMLLILGCVVAWCIKRGKLFKFRLPAFVRRKLSRDKYARYHDEAFDNEGF